jgi:hypothetical protein
MSADIQVISVDPVTNQVSFGIKPAKITGIFKLIQIVVLSLLNIPGQDVMNPDKGGGLPAMLGENIDPTSNTEVFGEIVTRVAKSQSEIINDQIGTDDPPQEKLSELQIVSITQGASPDEFAVTIRVVNEAGQSANIVM